MTALFRIEPKDVADIWAISKKLCFKWKSVVNEAKEKEIGVEPEALYDLLRAFPTKELDAIKWIQRPSNIEFEQDIRTIVDDLLFGKENSLCRS